MQVRKHQPARSFRLLHGIYTVYGGRALTGRFALGSPLVLGGLRGAAADAARAGLPDDPRVGQAVSVSVVIPTWNGLALLDVALVSLERQRLAPLEVIVVDNGSTDGTAVPLRSAGRR